MKTGDTGINVKKWQNYLNRWAVQYRPDLTPVVEDGVFGIATAARTLSFQQFSHIEDTGRVGYFDAATMAVAIGPAT